MIPHEKKNQTETNLKVSASMDMLSKSHPKVRTNL